MLPMVRQLLKQILTKIQSLIMRKKCTELKILVIWYLMLSKQIIMMN